jgi:integrase
MGVYARGSKLWIRFRDIGGKWRDAFSGYLVGQEALAGEVHAEIVARVAASEQTEHVKHAPSAPRPSTHDTPAVGTVRGFASGWIVKRRERELDWRNDESRLRHHVLPEIGDLPLAEVRARHLVDLFHKLRTDRKRNLAQRTIYNIYSVVSAMFRDAKLAGLIEQSPCVLDERQLGPLTDKDPEWRNDAVFARDEVETVISDTRIPHDRQIVYGLELLAGVRPGETAALRWRHYDPTIRPLGKLLVAKSYNTRKHREKSTKTDAVKHVPVHPVLAAMLAEWKLSGWAEMMSRAPAPDDLIVPLPPDAAERRRSRAGEPFRGHDYSGKRWREDDLPALGWRHRRHYDMRATFITLAIEDGADPEILETRVTHTRKSRSAFDGYNRGLHWDRTCAEIAKLRITRGARPEAIAAVVRGGGGSGSATTDDAPERSAALGEPSITRSPASSTKERRGAPLVPPSTPAASTIISAA